MFIALLVLIQTPDLDQKFEELKRRTIELTKAVELEGSPQGQKCRSYVGKPIFPVSFETAVANFANAPAKGEYETTAQFAARRAAAVGEIPKTSVISVPVDRDFLKYNADAQVLEISPYAFGEMGTKAATETELALFLLSPDKGVKADLGFDKQVLVPVQSKEIVTGTYQAQNPFGATALISKVDRVTKLIFDRAGDGSDTREDAVLFPAAQMAPHIIGTLPVSATAARSLKATVRLALVVEPKEPYYVASTEAGLSKPTLSYRRAVSEKLNILVADIQCGLVINGHGKVLGSYPTQ